MRHRLGAHCPAALTHPLFQATQSATRSGHPASAVIDNVDRGMAIVIGDANGTAPGPAVPHDVRDALANRPGHYRLDSGRQAGVVLLTAEFDAGRVHCLDRKSVV